MSQCVASMTLSHCSDAKMDSPITASHIFLSSLCDIRAGLTFKVSASNAILANFLVIQKLPRLVLAGEHRKDHKVKLSSISNFVHVYRVILSLDR